MTREFVSTRAQALKILEMKSQGLTNGEIADALDLSLVTVSRAINSAQSKEILAAAKKRLESLVGAAVDVYQVSLGRADEDMTNSLKAAKDVLKNFGLLRDQLELNHNFPKPTIIKRVDGTEVILGVEQKEEE